MKKIQQINIRVTEDVKNELILLAKKQEYPASISSVVSKIIDNHLKEVRNE